MSAMRQWLCSTLHVETQRLEAPRAAILIMPSVYLKTQCLLGGGGLMTQGVTEITSHVDKLDECIGS